MPNTNANTNTNTNINRTNKPKPKHSKLPLSITLNSPSIIVVALWVIILALMVIVSPSVISYRVGLLSILGLVYYSPSKLKGYQSHKYTLGFQIALAIVIILVIAFR